MAKATYIGVSDLAKKVKKAYIGVGDVAKKIKKMYVGDSNGVARLCWSSGGGFDTFALYIQSNTSYILKVAHDNVTDFSTTAGNLRSVGQFDQIFFKGRYITHGYPAGTASDNLANCGIYYRSSLSAAWTFAKRTANTKQRAHWIPFVKGNYAYMFLPSSTTAYYSRSSDGVNWTIPTIPDSYYSGPGGKYGGVSLYNGKLYLSSRTMGGSSYTLLYHTFSSWNQNSGTAYGTLVKEGSSNAPGDGQLAIDPINNIGYIVTQSTYTPADTLYHTLHKIDLTSYRRSTAQICRVSNEGMCAAIVVNGKLYVMAGAILYANVVTAYNNPISWVGTIPAQDSNNGIYHASAMYYIDEKIWVVNETNSGWYKEATRHIYYRTGNTLTAVTEFSEDNYVSFVSTSGVEFFDYDAE